jgi:signal peptidase I
MEKKNSPFHDEEIIDDVEETNSVMHEFIGFFRDLIIILLIVIFIRSFVVTPFRINGSSMEDSYHDKEYILVNKFSYLNFSEIYKASTSSSENIATKLTKQALHLLPIHVGDPVRGDVVVITPHVDSSREYYIKRVIGLPGDTIHFSSGSVFIKKSGEEKFIQINEPYLNPGNKEHTFLPEYVEGDQFLIPEGTYWVMGDNRNNSADSRSCFRNCFNTDIGSHFIKRQDVVGSVLLNFGYFNVFHEGGLLSDGNFKWTYAPRFLDHPRNATYPELNQ